MLERSIWQLRGACWGALGRDLLQYRRLQKVRAELSCLGGRGVIPGDTGEPALWAAAGEMDVGGENVVDFVIYHEILLKQLELFPFSQLHCAEGTM